MYLITGVTDGSVTIGGSAFDTALAQRFAILRKFQNPVWSCPGTFNSTNTVTLSSSLRTRGVRAGDWLITENSSIRYHIHSLISTGSSFNKVQVYPTPSFTATYDVQVYCPEALNGTLSAVSSITGDGSNRLTAVDDFLIPLANPGDELLIDGLSYFFLDPQALYVTPIMPVGTFDAQLVKNTRLGGEICFDHNLNYNPADSIEAAIISPSGTATVTPDITSADVTFSDLPDPTEVFLPGDFLVLTSGSLAVIDVGYGPGRFPVIAVTNTEITVAWPLISGTPPQMPLNIR